jgi:molybdate transport system permease protein
MSPHPASVSTLLAVDSHVHFHDMTDPAGLFDACLKAFRDALPRMLKSRAFSGMLVLTEPRSRQTFASLLALIPQDRSAVALASWMLEKTGEEISLRAVHRSGETIFLLAGQQIVTAENLEVLSLLSLPLILPPTAVGLVLLDLLARGGPFGRVLSSLGIEVVFTWKAVVLATAVMSFPLLVRAARTAFEEVDPQLVGVARTLGCGPLAAFARVTLPLAWRGLLSGTVLAFSRALGEFGATIMVAGNIPGRTQTLALAIFHNNQIGRDDRAWRLVALTVALAFVAMWCVEWLGRRHAQRVGR